MFPHKKKHPKYTPYIAPPITVKMPFQVFLGFVPPYPYGISISTESYVYPDDYIFYYYNFT